MPKRKLTAAELLSFNLRRLMDEQGMTEAEVIPGKPYIAAMNLRGDYLRRATQVAAARQDRPHGRGAR